MLGTLNHNTTAETQTKYASNKSGHKTPTVLLVDDNDFNLLIAGTYLENFGYNFDVSKSGHDALEKIYTKQYDAILMDIQMPLMDGMETAQHIRDFEKKNNLERQPIIALTAHPYSGDKQSCQSAGMDDYLSKPFNPAHLRELIEKFLIT